MVKPVKINPDQRFSRAWQPKQRVWFQKNDDSNLGKEEEKFSDWANRKTPYNKEESHRIGKERAERATKRLQQGLDPFGED